MTNDTSARPIWRPGLTLDYLRAKLPQTLAEHVGINLTELGASHLTGTMKVDDRTCQPMRMLHGGASVVLAETIGSLAANAVNQDAGRQYVGQQINANHLLPVPEGDMVAATARPVHIGMSSQVWSIEIRDGHNRLVCISRLTMAAVPVPPDQRSDGSSDRQ